MPRELKAKKVDEGLLYMVMRLNTLVLTKDYLGREVEIKLSNCAGYCPIYDNMEDAEKASDNGKYQIHIIKTES